MVLVFIAFPFVTIFLCYLVFVFFLLFLGVALHNIHAFHSRCFFFNIKKKRKEKEANCVFALFSLFLKTRLVNLFSHDMSFVLFLALKSFLLHLTSWNFVIHVVSERCLWCLSLYLNFEITCYLTVRLEPFEKGINNHLTTIH